MNFNYESIRYKYSENNLKNSNELIRIFSLDQVCFKNFSYLLIETKNWKKFFLIMFLM